MKNNYVILCIILCLGCSNLALSQNLQTCKAYLHNDTLSLENDVVFQHFRWNNGNLIRLAFGERKSGQSIIAPDNQLSFNTGTKGAVTKGKRTLQVTNLPATSIIAPAYTKVEVLCSI